MATLTSISINVNTDTVTLGNSTNFNVIATYSDNSTKDVTDYCSYSVSDNDVIELMTTYLTFTALQNATFRFPYNDLQYSLDDGETWTTLTAGSSTPTISTGNKILWKQTGLIPSSSGIGSFYATGNFNVSGNIMSLYYGDDFINQFDLTGKNYAFYNLFEQCTNLISAENLALPATTLSNYCYYGMFSRCTSLTTAPVLPATTLASYCYDNMFYRCTSLTTVPELPATTLATSCYRYMFFNCTSLTTAPALQATTLADYCCQEMFSGCTNLTTTPALPATTLTQYCYNKMFFNCTNLTTVQTISATTLANYCCQEMFSYCSELTTTPALPATTLKKYCYSGMFAFCTNLTTAQMISGTTLADYCCQRMFHGCTSLTTVQTTLPATSVVNCCYYRMFEGCTSLTTAPALPATWTTNTYCYEMMFYGCSSLNYIKCLSTSNNSMSNWVYGVAATGTFVKDPNMSSWTTGSSGIPTGWTVQDYNPYADQYLTFTALEDGTFSFTTNDLQYSIDNGSTWSTLTAGNSTPTVTTGNKIMFKQTGLTPNDSGIGTFSSTGNFNASGNIMSLYYGDNFVNQTSLSGKNYAFNKLFYGCTKLVDALNLILPATTLAESCYRLMFQNCTSLTTAPELPATTLASDCYRAMFNGCTSLTTAPVLPATTLAESCYRAMFQDCSSLTTAPELPATTLAESCYRAMFQDCSSLTTAPELPATTLASNCYRLMFKNCTSLTTAPELPATTLTESCYNLMFNGCTSLTTAPELPATTLADSCYYQMFSRCTSLTTAPELPATTLADSCYYQMFKNCTSLTTVPELPATTLADSCYFEMFLGCTSLNYIKCLATNISASNCTYNWVYGVASTGTFVKDPNMSSWTTGNNGIPSGWTVIVDMDPKTPLLGEFSVSSTKKVRFSCGNLQAFIGGGPDATGYNYLASRWKFAEHQYKYIGNTDGNSNFVLGSIVDLFGWVGASASYDSYGLCTNTSTNNAYYGTSASDALKTDWGSIPGVVSSCGSGWHTLTSTEWNYLFTQRTNASSLYGHCQITTASGTVTGMLILPDNWTKPSNCMVTPGKGAYTRETYDATVASGASNAWCDMQAAGAVFLPAAGYRFGVSVYENGGYYWTSSVFNVSNAYSVYFYSGNLDPQKYSSRCLGFSVRLVKDAN